MPTYQRSAAGLLRDRTEQEIDDGFYRVQSLRPKALPLGLHGPDSLDEVEAGVHHYFHYANHDRIKCRSQGAQSGGVPIERHRLTGVILTVQLLGLVQKQG
jgi:hypothetical protein